MMFCPECGYERGNCPCVNPRFYIESVINRGKENNIPIRESVINRGKENNMAIREKLEDTQKRMKWAWRKHIISNFLRVIGLGLLGLFALAVIVALIHDVIIETLNTGNFFNLIIFFPIIGLVMLFSSVILED